MVFQSRDGVLRLFPWLSADFAAAEFGSLRAFGGYVVSASWSAAGGVSPVTIEAPAEPRRCRLQVPAGWRAAYVCRAGRAVGLRGDGDGVVSFAGEAGATYVAQPTPCAAPR